VINQLQQEIIVPIMDHLFHKSGGR